MSLEDFAVQMRKLIVEPVVIWRAIEGPPGHPEARAFSGSNGQWQFLVVGAPPDESGCIPIGGTAVNLESGAMFILPLEVAQLGFDCTSIK